MTRPALVVWFVLATAAVGWCGWRLGAGAGDLQRAEREAEAARREVARVLALRHQVRGLAAARRPDGDLIARVQRALVAAALPAGALSGVQPRADRQSQGSGLRVQSVQVTLRALSPAELGSWLAAWRQGEQPWRLDEVQLAHAQPAGGATGVPGAVASGDDNRYDVTLALAAPYVEDPQ
jgi:hypothetical protein